MTRDAEPSGAAPAAPWVPAAPARLLTLGSAHAEVRGRHRRIGLYLLRGPAGDHLPEVQHDERVTDGHHQVHVVLHDDEGRLRGEFANEPAKLAELTLGQAAGGLIEQQ